MSRLRQWARPSLASLGCTLPSLLKFAAAWAFLDCLVNLHYPAAEPTLWYLLPSIDVVIVLAVMLGLRACGRRMSAAGRVSLAVALFATRIFRFAEGLVDRHFHRPFNLYLDVPLIPDLVRLLRSTVSLPRLLAGTALAVLAIAAIFVVTLRALGAVERGLDAAAARRLFAVALVACAALSPLWSHRRDPHLHVGLFGASIVPRLGREGAFLWGAADYRREKAQAIATVQDNLRRTPSHLDRLHRADVLLFLVESYGETVLEHAPYARRMNPVLDAFEAELGRHGFAAASSLIASPTYGGRSWLAHASLATGVRIEDGLAYTLLLQAQPPPMTMAGFFRDAGYRTVLVQPGTTRRWPEGEVIGFDRKYYAMDLEYLGPPFKWATMPDQYVIDFIHRREVAVVPDPDPASATAIVAGARPPLFIEYALVSSHSPWSVQPRVVPEWDQLGHGGRIFSDLAPVRYPITWSNLGDGGDAYVTSLIYDFDVLRRYLVERVADDALIILLGDHQPSAEVTHDDLSPGVPIHVISRDRAFVQRFTDAGYVPGMRARATRPLAGMETFLPQILRMFSSPRPAPPPPRHGA